MHVPIFGLVGRLECGKRFALCMLKIHSKSCIAGGERTMSPYRPPPFFLCFLKQFFKQNITAASHQECSRTENKTRSPTNWLDLAERCHTSLKLQIVQISSSGRWQNFVLRGLWSHMGWLSIDATFGHLSLPGTIRVGDQDDPFKLQSYGGR